MDKHTLQTPQPTSTFSSRTFKSKYLALLLFITLPFFGFYFGIQYQKLQQSQTSDYDIGSYTLLQTEPGNLTTKTDINNRFTFLHPIDYDIDYFVYNSGWDSIANNKTIFRMQNDTAYHNMGGDIAQNEFQFHIEVSTATTHDRDRINTARNPYNNNNVIGMIELIDTRDSHFSEYQDVQVSMIHLDTLYRFQLLGKHQYYPAAKEAQSIFHTILSTLTFHEPIAGYYEDENIYFSYPADWHISRSKVGEEQYSVMLSRLNADLSEDVFIFNPNGTIFNGLSFEETVEKQQYYDTQYGGTRYVGYGDYQVSLSKTNIMTIGGRQGKQNIYHQEPQNLKVGSIHFIYIPIENERYYKVEYSGPNKNALNEILNSIVFK